MATLNSIGPYYFVSLRGMPDCVKPELEAEYRPGVDGVMLTWAGRHQRKFTLHSGVDAPSWGLARFLYVQYCQLIGSGPLPVVWSGYDLSTEGTLFAVTDVRLTACRPCATGIGGLNPPSQGWLECDWDLIALPL